MIASVRRVLAAAGWFVAVLIIALGAAGLVTALDQPLTGAATRPELTEAGDAAVSPVLDAQEAEVRLLADDVTALATDARTALAALNGTDIDAVEAAVAAGDEHLAAIRARTARIAAALDDIPILTAPDGPYRVADAVRARHAALVEAIAATRDLEAAWIRLTTGSVAASRLSLLLQAHVDAVARAARQGRAADYDAAVATLDEADAAIAGARALRDRLAATVDVTTLDAWLDRNADYDVALRALYLALRDVGGRVTDDVRAAIKGERAAKERLPGDARGLIVIMGEIGRSGMNGAVIAIEEARGALTAALEDASAGGLEGGSGRSPTTAPAPTSAPGGTLTPPP